MNNNLGIYIHIPFCVKKCNYCDFLSGPADVSEQSKYVTVLATEIKRNHTLLSKKEVDTIFIGGGTPSLLMKKGTDRIFQTLSDVCSFSEDVEFTIECNPGTVSKEKLRSYKKAGVNRVSFGLQSTVHDELKQLGRIHTYEDFLKSYEWARDAGFENINIDLMTGIPGQTLKSYERTCKQILSLAPEHISAYSLIIEEGTPFYESYAEEPPVSEEEDRLMYVMTKEILLNHGYDRYEISNYSKKGKQCRHNLKYWSLDDYIGFGLGAASLLDGSRLKNESEITNYESKIVSGGSPVATKELLSDKEQMEEFMFLGLRKCEGISKKRFLELFSLSIENIYGDVIKKFTEQELLIQTDNQIFLSERGLDLSNVVMSEFIL